MPGTYLDFDVLIEHAAQGYRAKVLDSPTGQATADFSLPFSSQDMEVFLLRLTRSLSQARRRVRRLESQERELVKGFGGQLFQAMFSGAVLAALQGSLNEASRKDAGLRIRLRLTDTPELADVPWEFLFNPGANRFLNLASDTPLIRYLDLPMPVRPITVNPPLRVLVMISSPTDFAQLDVGAEWDRLNAALHEVVKTGLVTITRLPSASLAGLQRPLRREKYHIFHFIGHGGFDEHAQDGALALEDEQGRAHLVSGQDLGVMLSTEHSLRLVVLNACEGARAATSDPFAGVAQSLVQQGIPAVIAMQFEITDEAAITFAGELYAAIADGYSVDAALGEARRAIFASGNDVEWATPVLYTRSATGQLFRVTKSSEAARVARDDAEREEAARLAREQAEREEAARLARAQAERRTSDVDRAPVQPIDTPGHSVAPEGTARPGSWRRVPVILAAVVVAFIAGAAMIALLGGGGGQRPQGPTQSLTHGQTQVQTQGQTRGVTSGSDSQFQALLPLLPATVRKTCINGRNDTTQNWMIRYNGALAQATCEAYDAPYLTYGLWPNASDAQNFAATALLGPDMVLCATNTINKMKAILPGATTTCTEKASGQDAGIFMVWNEDGSPVAAHYWRSNHDQAEALNGWRQVAQAP